MNEILQMIIDFLTSNVANEHTLGGAIIAGLIAFAVRFFELKKIKVKSKKNASISK